MLEEQFKQMVAIHHLTDYIVMAAVLVELLILQVLVVLVVLVVVALIGLMADLQILVEMEQVGKEIRVAALILHIVELGKVVAVAVPAMSVLMEMEALLAVKVVLV